MSDMDTDPTAFAITYEEAVVYRESLDTEGVMWRKQQT